MAEDESGLVDRARRGDLAAFDQLVERYLERTFHVSLRFVGNREDAEDITQETFARAHRNLSRFQGGSSFGTWVTSIAIRLCLDLERARRRRPPLISLEASLVPLEHWPSRAAGPSLQAQQRETWGLLQEAIQRLPTRLRTALVLRVLEGQEYATVAQALGTTIRSSRIYVSEARRKLAQWWKEHDDA